jgi:hypothetical protein
MLKEKSQTAIEFMIIVGFVLGMFTVLFLSIQSSTGGKVVEQNTKAVQEVAYTIQDEINLAASSTDGYKRTFILPPRINGMDYDITLVNTHDYVQINTTNGRYSMGVSINKIEPISTIEKGNNTVLKQNGNITVTHT